MCIVWPRIPEAAGQPPATGNRQGERRGSKHRPGAVILERSEGSPGPPLCPLGAPLWQWRRRSPRERWGILGGACRRALREGPNRSWGPSGSPGGQNDLKVLRALLCVLHRRVEKTSFQGWPPQSPGLSMCSQSPKWLTTLCKQGLVGRLTLQVSPMQPVAKMAGQESPLERVQRRRNPKKCKPPGT